MADLALLDDRFERTQRLLHRRDLVEAVDLVKIDMVDLKALEAALQRVEHMRARCATRIRAVARRPEEFGGDDYIFPCDPEVAQRLALVVDIPRKAEGDTIAFAVGAVTPELLDAWSRMLRLLDAPDEIDTLAPLIEREILFRLLQGPQGALLRQAARAGSRISQVRDTIAHLRTNLGRVVRIEELVEIAGVSVATFHRHFRAATAMSPLQYHKTLRLQEARRLLLAHTDATSAAFAVGYESASQFSREYTRMFGTPPARDAGRLRAGRD